MDGEPAHVDMGNQIDNSWNKDTALALKLKDVTKTVKIRAEDKKSIRDKYFKEIKTRKDERYNRRIIVLIYSFLLYKLLDGFRGIIKKVKLCNDISPTKDVYSFLRFLCKYYKTKNLDEEMKIKFKERNDGVSKAHNIANKTAKGRRKEDYLIRNQDMTELNEIIQNKGKDGS